MNENSDILMNLLNEFQKIANHLNMKYMTIDNSYFAETLNDPNNITETSPKFFLI